VPKRHNPNLAKKHFSYSIQEVAELYGVHPHTVREWIKKGLRVIDGQRPVLIQGAVLREFIQDMNKHKKRPCADNELYCLSCRKPQVPLGEMVDYVPSDDRKGCLIGLCPNCERTINRFATLNSIDQLSENLEINIRPIKNT